MSAISRSDIERIISEMSSDDIKSLKAEDFSQFQYQGFDPYALIGALLKIKNSREISTSTFKKDIVTMCAIGMIKGSVNDHNLTKMSDEGKAGVTSLLSTYGIVKGGGKGLSREQITFPRVMASFPDVAVKLVSVIGHKDFSGGPMVSTRLPDFMKVQVFPSVIPRGLQLDVKRFLLAACLCYSIDQTVVISQLKSYELNKIVAEQGNFVKIGHESPVPPEAARVTLFKSLDWSDAYDNLVNVIKDYQKVDPTIKIPTLAEFKKAIE